MKKRVLFIISFCIATIGFSQEKNTDSLFNASELVLRVELTNVYTNGDMDLGAAEFTLTGKITTVYKGTFIHKEIEFIVIRHSTSWDGPVVGDDLIVFLKKVDWIISPQTDLPFTLTHWQWGMEFFTGEMDHHLKTPGK